MTFLAQGSFSLKQVLCGGQGCQNLGIDNILDTIFRVTAAATVFAGAVALIFLIYGGILYLTSAGNSGQAEKAKGAITWSIVGLIVVIGAYALIQYFASLVIKGA